MRYTSLAVAALMGVAQSVNVQVVAVGMNPTNNDTEIKFFPDKITAEPGTMVQFQFWAGNHTVTQSNFDNPCVPISDSTPSVQGIYSGYQPVGASSNMGMIPVFTIMVNDTKPMWLFCSKAKHCQGGMALVINENTTANKTRSLENYKSASKTVTTSDLVPGVAAGGGSGSAPGSGTGGRTGGGAGASPSAGTPNNSSATSAPGAPGATGQPAFAGASSYGVSSTLLMAVGAAFMLF